MKKLLLIAGAVFVTAFVSGCADNVAPGSVVAQGDTNDSAATNTFMANAEAQCNMSTKKAYELGKEDGAAGALSHAHGFTLCTDGTLSDSYVKGVQAANDDK